MWAVVLPHLTAAGRLSANAMDAKWTIDAANWRRGGQTQVNFTRRWFGHLGNEHLALLDGLHRLTAVQLNDCDGITDEGMPLLARHPDLEDVSLDRAATENSYLGLRLTDRGLRALKGLTKLKRLSIRNAAVTDDGLDALEGMPDLEELELRGTAITDAGAARLAKLTRLKWLDPLRHGPHRRGRCAFQGLRATVVSLGGGDGRDPARRRGPPGGPAAGVCRHLGRQADRHPASRGAPMNDSRAVAAANDAAETQPRTEEGGPLLLPPAARRGRFRFWARVTAGLVLLAVLVPGWLAWRFVSPRYSAIIFCRMYGNVAWDLDGTNWRTVGTTDVSFNPYARSAVRFANGTWGGVIRSASDLTDADLARLADLPPVQTLDLTAAGEIKVPGLAVLSRLPELDDLRMNRALTAGHFHGPIVRDETLRRIAAGPRLRVLQINGARVTDEGLAPIASFAMLEDLDLAWTKIGDAGLAHLRGLKNLEKLDLTATRVTDAGLLNFRDLPGLKVLVLHRTRVTRTGITALKAALPGLDQVDFGGMVGHEFDREDTTP